MAEREDRDQNTGRFTGKYSDDEFVDAVDAADMAGTSDVIDVVGCSQKTAYDRLTRLADDGVLERTEIGGTIVWRVSDE